VATAQAELLQRFETMQEEVERMHEAADRPSGL
jgi:hypothetical protein